MAQFEIEEGPASDVLDRVVGLHDSYYRDKWGFGEFFHDKMVAELSSFLEAYDPDRDRLWTARAGGQVEGSIAIDGTEAAGDGASLRWFIVSDSLRGMGAGSQLICRAMEFCREKAYPSVGLWTFAGLDAARALYEREGFILMEQRAGEKWGPRMIEQRFECTLARAVDAPEAQHHPRTRSPRDPPHRVFGRGAWMTRELQTLGVDQLDSESRSQITEFLERAFDVEFGDFFGLMRETTHVLLIDEDGSLLSHGAWVERWLQPAGLPPLRTAYIEAMATEPALRGQGLGSEVLARIGETIMGDSGWELGGLSPMNTEFYARQGWEMWRGPLAIRHEDRVEPSPPDEQVMVLRLQNTPEQLDLDSLLTAEWRDGELW